MLLILLILVTIDRFKFLYKNVNNLKRKMSDKNDNEPKFNKTLQQITMQHKLA